MSLPPVRRQLGILGRAPGFRLLFLSTLASGLGTWLAVIALTVDVFDRTHSAKWVSALLAADFLPAIAIGLFLGPLVDRISRKLLMVVADVVRLGVFAALPFAGSPGQIVGLAAVAGLATGLFRPAALAGLPNLVAEDDLADANALLRVVEYFTTTAGTLLGGTLAAAGGPDLAYSLNAGTFAVSALLLVRLPARLLQEARVPSRGHLRDVLDGFSLVRRSRALLLVFWVWNLAMFASGSINVAEVALAKESFNAGSFGFGLMWTASGLGLLAGSLYASSWLARRGVEVVYGASLAVMAVGWAAAAVSPDVWVAVWFLAVGGAGNGAAVICNSLLVQRGAPDHLRGRAFTTIMSVNFALLGIAMGVAGPITDAVGARWTYAAAAAIAGAAAVLGFSLARGLPRDVRKREAVPGAV